MAIDAKYKHSELTDIVIKTFYEVYNELGYGFAEVVYRNSLQIALLEKGLDKPPGICYNILSMVKTPYTVHVQTQV